MSKHLSQIYNKFYILNVMVFYIYYVLLFEYIKNYNIIII